MRDKTTSRARTVPDEPDISAAERITVGLLARVAEDLRDLRARTGMSKTDLINRSISLYAYIDARLAAGDEILLRSENGEIERVKII